MIVSKKHKRSIYTTRVVTHVTSIPFDEWQKVFPDVLESYGFFKTLDEACQDQFSFYYILAYRKKTLFGIAPCFLVNYPLDTSINGPLRHISNRIKKYKPDIFSIKAIVCGIPMGEGALGIIGDSDKIIQAILRRLEQVARKERASLIAFKDFGSSYTERLDKLKKFGFTKFESLPSTVLNIRFEDFEGYLKTLSHKSRYDLRNKLKKTDKQVKIEREVITTPGDDAYNEIFRLYNEVVNSHEMGFEVLTIDFFKKITKNMPNSVKYFLWRLNDKLVAFSLCLASKDHLLGYYIGLDYSVAYKYHLYFYKFRDILNWCIKNGIKRYELGYTGYSAKRQLGFNLVPLYLYVKLRNPILRPAFNLVCQFLKFDNFDPALKEMKEKKKRYEAETSHA